MTNWPVKTLGDLMSVQNGYAFDSQFFSADGTIGLIRIRDLKNGITTETHFDGPYDDQYVVTNGDYLIGMDGEFRCYEWKGTPALLNQRVCRLRDFAKSLDARFLFYGINKFLKDIEDVTGFTTVKHLSSKSILAIEMPVPPLEEQKRIVALLDEATTCINELEACYEQARTHANNLFSSALSDALEGGPDWSVKALGEVCSIESVLVDPREKKYSSMIHIGAGNIESRTGRLFDIKTVSEEKLISGKYLFTTDDVLYSKIRPYLVKVATPEVAGLCSADVYPLRPGSLLTRKFLFYSLISETFTDYAIGGSSRAGMPKVNREHLFKYEMRVPPISVQSEIVNRLEVVKERTSEMVTAYQAKLASASSLRRAILEAAFAGEL
jgi:type I restriction enzyme S subunit